MIPLPGIPKPEEKDLESDIFLLRRRVANLEKRFYCIGYETSSTLVDIVTQDVYVEPNITFDEVFGEGLAASTTYNFGLKNVTKDKFRVIAQGTADITHGSANAVVAGMKLAKNGTAISGAECRATMAGGNGIAKLNSTAIIDLSPGDEVHITLANHTSNIDVTVDRAKLWVTRVPGEF